MVFNGRQKWWAHRRQIFDWLINNAECFATVFMFLIDMVFIILDSFSSSHTFLSPFFSNCSLLSQEKKSVFRFLSLEILFCALFLLFATDGYIRHRQGTVSYTFVNTKTTNNQQNASRLSNDRYYDPIDHYYQHPSCISGYGSFVFD